MTEEKAIYQKAYDQALSDIISKLFPLQADIRTIGDIERFLKEQAVAQYSHGFEEGKLQAEQSARSDAFCQELYNEGYKKGEQDADARFRIGRVYAQNGQIRDLEAIKKLVAENPKLSDEYKRGKMEAIDIYLGMVEFSRDVDRLAVRETVEEKASIIRNRMQKRYREALEAGKLDRTSYLQINACIEATYKELFFAGFNVGTGNLIGPQKITVNKKKD